MFVFRNKQEDNGGNVLHNMFLKRFTLGGSEDMAALFAPGGLMRILDRDDGHVLDSASGHAGLASLARSIHENVELQDFRTMRLVWTAGVLDYAWTASVRNWGFGAARRTSGKIRMEFAAEGVQRADLSVDVDVYYSLIRPQGCVWQDGSWRHDLLLAV
jgi:hypothetical protein